MGRVTTISGRALGAAAPSAAWPGARARTWGRLAGEVLIIAIVALSAAFNLYGPTSPGRIVGLVATLLPASFLWLRGRHPAQVLAVCLGLFVVAACCAQFTPANILPVAASLYAFMVQRRREPGWYVAGAVLASTVIVTWLAGDGARFGPEPFPVAVSIAFAAALADSVRNRRAYIAEIVARADHAEATRESEAARRVSEERLRIARDLHDVVAHQISLISLNASVAMAGLDAQPEPTRTALLAIKGASRRVLGDIGDLLAVLRSDDEAALAPQPGLEQLPDLIDDFSRAGLAVTVRHEGGVPRLTPTGDVVAYRAVQEALTNATKHGAEARAHVLVQSTAEQVRIVVTNPTGVDAFAAEGYGLSGMRERVASVRGSVEIAVEAGVFRLEVRLPRDLSDEIDWQGDE
jgi:signal transduction histidine kinase